jgi:hypothetical protein
MLASGLRDLWEYIMPNDHSNKEGTEVENTKRGAGSPYWKVEACPLRNDLLRRGAGKVSKSVAKVQTRGK